MEANRKAQVGVTYSSMVANMSCGERFEKGVANLQRTIERKDVIERNNFYYESTHTLKVSELHPTGV